MALISFPLRLVMALSRVKESVGGIVSRENTVISQENAEKEEEFLNVAFQGKTNWHSFSNI